MKYYYQTGVIKQKKVSGGLKLIAIALLLLVTIAYLTFTALTPALSGWPLVNPNQTAQMVQTAPPAKEGYKLYIPKLNVIANSQQLELTGSPTKQEVVKVSGHAFQLGVTPEQTKDNSPFYRLNQLHGGDNIFLDYHSQRYAYRVADKDANLKDGGLVLKAQDRPTIKAEPIGIVAWKNGKAAIDTAAF